MRVWKKTVMLAIIATLVVAAMAIGPASATGNLLVNPSIVMDETTFTVTVEIDADVTNVWGFEFKLFYDTSVLTATASITGPPGGPEWPDVSLNEIDDAQGLVWVSASLPLGTTEGVDGPIELATIDFSVEGIGESDLNIDETYTPLLITPDVTEIPVNVVDGYFTNVRPKLWIAGEGVKKGAKVWTEWQVGSVGQPQIIYARIPNTGDASAVVKVKFIIRGAVVGELPPMWSTETIAEPDTTGATAKTVYAIFTPGPDLYYVKAVLYFHYKGETAFVAYSTVEAELGGAGTSRDIATKFKAA